MREKKKEGTEAPTSVPENTHAAKHQEGELTMNKNDSRDKSLSIFEEDLDELAKIKGTTSETLIEIHNECYSLSRDDIWARLCSPCPELEKSNEYDKKQIIELLAEIHKRKNSTKKKTKAPKEKKQVVIQTSIIENNGMLYEQIYRDGTASFIDAKGNIYRSLDIDGVKYAPIRGDELTEGAVLLPSGIEEYSSEQELINSIEAHIHKYVEVSPFFETISAYYILLSWLYDEVNTLPYLRVIGDTGTGKSRYEDVVGRLCYKATMVSGAITPAPIYRVIKKWRGTIIIDEGDFRASDEQNEVVKILNCGFERGRPVVRSQKDNPNNLQFLPTFGPKIISTRKRFKDVALESRCLTEVMRESDRDDLPYLLPSAFYEREAKLRNQLLLFKFKNKGTVDIEQAQKLKDIEVEDRLKQTMSSFVVLFANNSVIYDKFITFIKAYHSELIEERADTFEGAIVRAITDLVFIKNYDSKKKRIDTVRNVINVSNVSEVKITATDIRSVLIDKYGYREDLNTRTVGKRLRVLGITSERIWDKEEKKTMNLLVLEDAEILKLIKKYLPMSVIETYVNYEYYITYGEKERKNILCDGCRAEHECINYNAKWFCKACLKTESKRQHNTMMAVERKKRGLRRVELPRTTRTKNKKP